ncbi:MAG: sigma-54-dependent Fis family transcriptional regulator [Deltaproteobacteria bacterium]|nr:sigma-54-dependent Fis family transcriptional regulator [Deltaproteobacteria bacterium]
MKRGAFDYLRKPFEPSEIEIVITKALQHRELLRENARLRSEVAAKFSRGNIICQSAAMKAVVELVGRAAPTDYPVLIMGESGTGKDLVAKQIHYSSLRASFPFVSINCSAIPENLLESELFGHEKGAFSGATVSKPGFFSTVDKGTLFLDEIGDMSLALQPKLLRVLQDGEFFPVGSRTPLRTSVRIICASNQNIEQLIETGKFRMDLYYRINTIRLVLPPLRERMEEIPLLAELFLSRVKKARANAPDRFSREAIKRLMEYKWPGNVRELEHMVERAALICTGEEIKPEDLPSEILQSATADTANVSATDYRTERDKFEFNYFTKLLSQVSGDVQKAAKMAGIHRSTLYEKCAKLKITLEE